ncbi:glycosyltransferase family 32 protein [Sodiomyces alcalophilus JCM 7366]|uniref:glycosyltransferase family 32 protein n=1 Tax=Sodiomyces alcalophilus JCM 7366 TaxID=591952 RepID=UPI0039B607D0
MLSPRRAVATAAFCLIVLYLVFSSHSSSPATAPKIVEPNTNTPDTPDAQQNNAHTSNTPPSSDLQRVPKPVEQQRPMMDMSQLSLYDKLAYQFPYDMESKFPAYIWQTWKRNPQDAQFEFHDQEKSWTDQHPGFVHEVVTDDVAVDLLRLLYASVPQVLEAYAALPLPVLKADFFRYLILLARGGIYSDIDTYAIRSALEWVPERIPRSSIGLVIGIEADPDRPDWKDWYSRRIQFCQWTIQAKPGHPVLRDVVARITEETLKRKKTGELSRMADAGVVEFTGPAVWTDVIFDYFNDPRYFDMEGSAGAIDWRNFTGMGVSRKVGDVIVLPITGFSPGVGQMGAKEVDDPMAFVKHEFEGTWKPEELRHIGEIQ